MKMDIISPRRCSNSAFAAKACFIAALFAALSAASGFCADVYIGVTAGADAGKLKLAMAAFQPEVASSSADVEAAAAFYGIVRSDILRSRYFALPESEPAGRAKSFKKELDAWKKTGAQYLMTASAAHAADLWTLSGKVYDLGTGDAVVEKYYKGQQPAMRRIAHMFSDETVWRLTGKKGIAATRIAFSNDSSRNKEIYIVDYDGENILKLTQDKSISLFPRWSPDGMKIYYTTYRYGNPDAFVIDLKERRINPVCMMQGLNIPGAVSPDGEKLVITLSRGVNPHIYEMNLSSRELKRLTTRASAVDSSASYSPDGKFITYISDRAGNPQVYMMELATGKTQRLTRLNWCDTPRWSPSGEWIAFAGRAASADNMDIFLTDITGAQLRNLTGGSGTNEDPSWSPDGRFLSFTSTRDGGTRRIYVMDADGSAPHRITDIPGNSYTPAWSPN